MSASTCGMVAFFRVSKIKFPPEVCFASSEVILQEDVYDKKHFYRYFVLDMKDFSYRLLSTQDKAVCDAENKDDESATEIGHICQDRSPCLISTDNRRSNIP